jgi:hypothetical protein
MRALLLAALLAGLAVQCVPCRTEGQTRLHVCVWLAPQIHGTCLGFQLLHILASNISRNDLLVRLIRTIRSVIG